MSLFSTLVSEKLVVESTARPWLYLRAIIAVATEEHRLAPVIPESISLDCLQVPTLRVIGTDTGFKVLKLFIISRVVRP